MGAVMLHGFLSENFDQLVSRAQAKAAARRSPGPATPGPEPEVPPLLARLGAALRGESRAASGAGGVSHLAEGFGDLREAIAELAAAQGRAFAPEDLRALGRGLDRAIADAVAEHARHQGEASSRRVAVRLGDLEHDLRNHLQTASLSLRALRKGKEDVGGRAGDALARSLARLLEAVDTKLAAGRPDAGR